MADYLTVAEVKDYLANLTSGDDALLTKIITRASRDVDRLAGQFFDLKTAVTKVWDGSGTQALLLPWAWPLNAVTALQVRSGGEGSALVTVATSDYYLEPAGRQSGNPARWLELATRTTSGVNVFTAGKGTVSIAGDWGWSPTPDDIKEVTLELAVRSWRQRGSGASDAAAGAGASFDDVSRSLSPRSTAILRLYGYQRLMVG